MWHLEGYDKKTERLAKDYSLSFARTDLFLAGLLKRDLSRDQGGGWPLDADQLRALAPYIPEPLTPDRYDYILEYLQD
jgi:hypothetical protein